ncbi:MAG: initiation factor 2B [Halobacteriales archaeon]
MPERVVAVIRHREAVLCCRTGGLSLPARPIEGEEPEAALAALVEFLDVEPDAVDRRRTHGDALVALLSADGRQTTGIEHCSEPTWVTPSTLWAQGTEQQWRRYRAVAPTVEAVARDTERGSTAIAVDALWTLRDAAIEAAGSAGLDPVRATATRLLDARPSMAVLGNRLNRVMAGSGTPEEIADAATAAIIDTDTALEEAATLAADTVADGPILTLSRSGTVRRTLLTGRPRVAVLVSLPGGEGRAVAQELTAEGLSASVVPDAAVYDRLRSGEIDSVLVGADAVTSAGAIVNKVGTRATALAAELTDMPVHVVAVSDKIRPLAAGDVPLEPLFDFTPARLVTSVLTERGELTGEEIEDVAAEHRSLTEWRDADLG